MVEKWEKVAERCREDWKRILIEEGVPEEEVEADLDKLMKGAITRSDVRGVLITPEVDKALQEIFRFAFQGGQINLTHGALELAKMAIWPKEVL